MWIGYTNVKEFEQPDHTFKKFGNVGWFTNLDIKKRHEDIILWKPYKPQDFPKYDNYDAINVDKVCDIPCDYCESWEVSKAEYECLPKSDWEFVRKGFRNDIETVFIIPAKGTELRELLSNHSDGYREKIEEALGNALQYNPGIMGVPVTFLDKHNPEQFSIENPAEFRLTNGDHTTDALDRQTDSQTDRQTDRAACAGSRWMARTEETKVRSHLYQKDTVTESSECQLHSSINTTLNNSELSGTNTILTETAEKVSATDNSNIEEKDSIRESLSQRYCNGMMDVPITFLDKYNPIQFSIIGATESEGKGFSMGLWKEDSHVSQPLVQSSKKYKRIFISKIL